MEEVQIDVIQVRTLPKKLSSKIPAIQVLYIVRVDAA